MKNKPILILSGLILGFYFYRQIKKSKQIMFKIVGKIKPDFKSIPDYQFRKLPVNINIQLTNPTDFEIVVKAINLKLYQNNQLIGEAIKSNQFKIGANGSTIVPIIVLIDLENIGITMTKIIDMFKNPDKSQTYQIRGFIDSTLGRLVLAENFVL
jgi:hypothetical protein